MKGLMLAAAPVLAKQLSLGNGTLTSQYFRLFVDSSNLGGYIEIAELEFLNQQGADVFDTLPVVVNHSSAYGGSTVGSKVIDNDLESRWAVNGSFNEWLKFTFNSPVTISSMTMMALAPKGHGISTRAPKDFRLEVSSNGTDWNTVATWTGEQNWTKGEVRTFNFS